MITNPDPIEALKINFPSRYQFMRSNSKGIVAVTKINLTLYFFASNSKGTNY